MKRLSLLTLCSVCSCLLFLFVLTGCTGEKEKAKVTDKQTRSVNSGTTILATIPDDDKPPQVIPGHEADVVTQGQAAPFQIVFSESGRGVAYVAERGGKVSVVYNQRRGKEYSAVGTVVLSPDGQRIAYGAVSVGKACVVVDGKEGKFYDTVLTPVFSPDGLHVAYQAKEGEKWYIIVDTTQNTGTTASYTTPEFSADSKLIAFVEAAATNSQMRLIVSDLSFAKQNVTMSIGDQLFTVNRDRSRIAAVQVVNNKFRVIDFKFTRPDVVNEGRLYDVIEQLTLSDDGLSMVYCALQGRKRLIVLDNKEEPFPQGRLPVLPAISPDKRRVAVLLVVNNRISLHQLFTKNTMKGKSYDEAVDLSWSNEGSYAYAARNNKDWFVVVNGAEGPVFDRVVGPKFSSDGKFLVYRVRKGNKRFVVAADTLGHVLHEYPAFEQVFDISFTADGKSVAYGAKDGKNLVWRTDRL